MLSPVKYWHIFAICLLLLPSAAFAGAIEINGTCVLGTCPPVSGPSGAVQFNQSVGGMGSYSLLFPDTDTYSITWSFLASYMGSTVLTVNPVVTYTGVNPSVGNDVINFDFFQNYYDNSPGSWDGAYTENVPLALLGPVGAGSTASAELFYDGQGLGLIGPFGPGSNFGQNTVGLSGLTASTLAAEYEFNFDFTAGTLNGATGNASATVPEPYEAFPLGMVLIGVVWSRARRRSAL